MMTSVDLFSLSTCQSRGIPRSGGSYGGRDYGGRDYGGRGDYDRGHYNRGGGGGYNRREDQNRRVNYYESRAISKYGPPTRTNYRVLVKNLSTRVSWQDLKVTTLLLVFIFTV